MKSLARSYPEINMLTEKQIKNKDMAREPKENKGMEEYHFAGSGIYKPLTIIALNPQEAHKLWLTKRELSNPESEQPIQIINKTK